MALANLYANRTKNGGRRLPDVKHECYGKLSVKSFLNAAYCMYITLNVFTKLRFVTGRYAKDLESLKNSIKYIKL